jgi:hypothetical protein
VIVPTRLMWFCMNIVKWTISISWVVPIHGYTENKWITMPIVCMCINFSMLEPIFIKLGIMAPEPISMPLPGRIGQWINETMNYFIYPSHQCLWLCILLPLLAKGNGGVQKLDVSLVGLLKECTCMCNKCILLRTQQNRW